MAAGFVPGELVAWFDGTDEHLGVVSFLTRPAGAGHRWVTRVQTNHATGATTVYPPSGLVTVEVDDLGLVSVRP